MPEYTEEQRARVRAAFARALPTGRKRGPAGLTYERLADELAAVADDFRGADRDDISHVIHLLRTKDEGDH